jgi:hypothetical protein
MHCTSLPGNQPRVSRGRWSTISANEPKAKVTRWRFVPSPMCGCVSSTPSGSLAPPTSEPRLKLLNRGMPNPPPNHVVSGEAKQYPLGLLSGIGLFRPDGPSLLRPLCRVTLSLPWQAPWEAVSCSQTETGILEGTECTAHGKPSWPDKGGEVLLLCGHPE